MPGYNLIRTVFFCLKICFTFSNSVDPDEMQLYAFHLGLNGLQKYLFSFFQASKIAFFRSFLRVPQAARPVKILIFLV